MFYIILHIISCSVVEVKVLDLQYNQGNVSQYQNINTHYAVLCFITDYIFYILILQYSIGLLLLLHLHVRSTSMLFSVVPLVGLM